MWFLLLCGARVSILNYNTDGVMLGVILSDPLC